MTDPEPLTPEEEAIVRQAWNTPRSWPVPQLLAEIDWLRAALAVTAKEPQRDAKVGAIEPDLAAAIYGAVVQPDTIWWDDLTPEMQEPWLRASRALRAAIEEADRD